MARKGLMFSFSILQPFRYFPVTLWDSKLPIILYSATHVILQSPPSPCAMAFSTSCDRFELVFGLTIRLSLNVIVSELLRSPKHSTLQNFNAFLSIWVSSRSPSFSFYFSTHLGNCCFLSKSFSIAPSFVSLTVNCNSVLTTLSLGCGCIFPYIYFPLLPPLVYLSLSQGK